MENHEARVIYIKLHHEAELSCIMVYIAQGQLFSSKVKPLIHFSL